MIVSKTPYRISFFGGGTDYPDWYKDNEGQVINSSIDKYSYIVIKELSQIFNYKIRLRYFSREEVKNVNDIKHPSARECLKFFNLKKNLEILHFGDLPAATGIGSSSAFTVGLLNGLYKYKNKKISGYILYKKAIEIEQKKLKENVGSQDQIATSLGGFNHIKFYKDKIKIKKIQLSQKNLANFQSSLFLAYTGIQRSSNKITEKLKKNFIINKKYLENIYKSTDYALEEFSRREIDLKAIGEIINYQWEIKKKLTNNVTSGKIDEIISIGKNCNVYGSKIIGAGGGGFVLFLANKKSELQLKKKLERYLIKINMTDNGSIII